MDTQEAMYQQEQLRMMRLESERISRLSKDALLSERPRYCRHCLKKLEPYRHDFTLFGQARAMWLWRECDCPESQEYRAARRAEQIKVQELDRQAEYEHRLKRAGLDGMLQNFTFENYLDRNDWPQAPAIRVRVRVYANAMLNGALYDRPWLVLHGDFGMGKSHLAGAIVRLAIDHGLRDCFFRAWTRYLGRLQATWDRRSELDDEYGAESEQDIVNELTRGNVVAIDDLDKRPASEWVRGVLYDVINTRYNMMLPTVLTFNHSIHSHEIQNYIGGAVLDRIMQHAYDVVEFLGTSYRQR